MGKRSIEKRIEKAESSTTIGGDGSELSPAITRVKDRIVAEYDREAYMEALTSVVLATLPSPSINPNAADPARTEAGWPDPAPASGDTAFGSLAERDVEIANLAEVWHEAHASSDRQEESA